ncbi:hypothetical protein HYFRA_00007577 [Hymenoscyphus fraxineus]|uniref:VOC domain-containing protein n=1 Tax=Hymenoscyphus fraxineus TaxID=746836 RepID=A0A9N9KTY1_9HELO|nr:hypothetical protein HYFRA_00007577 [Hymenoscyphus fraxineus]
MKLIAVLLLPFLTSLTIACPPVHSQPTNSTAGYPKLTPGTDGPADSATTQYQFNHVALLVKDLTETRKFYGDILGMRMIFLYEETEDYSIMYMAHSQGGKNGTGYQTGAEMIAEKNNMQGLIEFTSSKSFTRSREYVPNTRQTLSHLGLIVPDVKALQDRVEAFNATILKRVDDAPSLDNGSVVALGFGIDPASEEAQELIAPTEALGFFQFLVFADPDGNLIEAQQQIGSAAV